MKKNKNGFTLLEVVLSMAIMLIMATMIIEGFMSTLSYSANSALYARQGNANVASVNQVVAKKMVGKDKPGSSSGVSGVTNMGAKKLNLTLQKDSANAKFTVNTWKTTKSGKFISLNKGEESGNVSTNRYALSYSLPSDIKCPSCHKPDNLAISAKTGKWYCSECRVYCN
ncbi:MAG: type II secretion system GspH family protein [Clostridiales bacterium]|nr:type II secretion system GspH family protein [Clostridiales bacterium]